MSKPIAVPNAISISPMRSHTRATVINLSDSRADQTNSYVYAKRWHIWLIVRDYGCESRIGHIRDFSETSRNAYVLG